MDSCLALILLCSTISLTTAVSVRLVDGGSRCAGRVEVYRSGKWGTVCDYYNWDMTDAAVVCRELDCGEAQSIAKFGPGSGPTLMGLVSCRGSESTLNSCYFTLDYSHYCTSHDQDVGVTCSDHRKSRLADGPGLCSGRVEVLRVNTWSTVCDGDFEQQDAEVVWSSLVLHEGRVRLSGGMECEGEVEVYFRQDWRRVLLDSWSESDASVVCRQLGCGSMFSFSSSSPSSPDHSHMCVTGFSCSGSEAHLGNCSSAETVNCSSREQLLITCSALNVAIRLVGSGGDCAGRLDVFYSGSWGTVSDDVRY
ncbi:antigen WC1.1-like [Colossoma macropomum]|uniref:antigen WC1.1-like n=1 Tax=Colossoma macropomum TaxID=42526 RepID=UPI001864DAA7|nr:antigen WC1.1-like [Colossoma macropomum]